MLVTYSPFWEWGTAQAAKQHFPKKTVEVTDLRTTNSKTYLQPDGKTYVTEQYLHPIHFQQKGQWIPIDNTIRSKSMDANHVYTNGANQFRVGFAKSTKTANTVKFQMGNHSLAFQPVDALDSTAVVKGNQITYPNIYVGVDLVYTVTETGIKEEWHLKKKPSRSTFSTKLHLLHLQPKENKDGSISLVDDKGKTVSSIPKPTVFDAKGATTTSLQYKLRTEKGQTFLDVVVDEKWLQDDKRTYPIVVDPSLTIQGSSTTFDTFLANGSTYQSTNFGGETFLITGTHPTYGVTRSLVKFQLSPLLSGAQIQSAKLNLNQYLTTTNTEAVDVYPITSTWTSSTATWSNPPTVGTKISTTNVTAAGAYDFDVTSLAKNWYSGTTANNGVQLRFATETHDRKSYRSSDYATDPTQKPKLTITYTIEPLGVEAFWTTASSNVNTYNGNYYLEDNDVSIDGRGPNSELTRSYNSRANTSGIFGANWTTNIEQKITDSGNGPILYQDGDGTYHTFTPPVSGNGAYDHPSGVYLDLYKNSDGTYTIIDKDQTIYKFNSTGKLWQIVDSNANVLSIGYTNGLPTSITDPSGRVVTLGYNADNHVETVTDPANRTITYGYDTSGNLKTVTHKDELGTTLSVDQYDYDTAHQLTTITDPNNNTETIVYTNNKVTSMSHPITSGGSVQTATTTIDYDTTNNITTVTDPKNHVTKYTNNDNGNVVRMVQDPSGLNYQTDYTYDGNNNLTDTKDPNTNAASGSATYHTTYDNNGNVLTETNPLNETSETTYDAKNNPITEKDPNGNTSTNEYDDQSNETASTDAATKSSATKYDSYGNVTEETSEMSPGNNLAINGSFEIDRNSDGWPDNWSKVPAGTSTISVDPNGLTTDGIIIGKKSIKITNPTTTTAVASDRITYNPNKTYVISGYAKTSGAAGQAKIYVFGFNTSTGTYQAIPSSYITGTQDTTRLHVVIEPGDMPAGTNQLEIRGYTTSGAGTYWFDGLQVEEGFYGAYNTLENSSFERDTDPADSIPDRWFLQGNTAAGDGIDTTEKHAGNKSVKLVGDPATFKSVYQDVQVSGAVGAQFTVSGFSKVTNPTAGKVYGYIINTYDASNTLQEKFTFNFDSSKSHDWQHLAATIKTTKAFDHIRVYYEYSQQTGTAWFDTAKVIIGSIRTQHTYDPNGNYETKTTDAIGNTADKTYDSVGNTKTEKVGTSDTTQYSYDGLNRLSQVTDAKNNVTKYQYDNNGNKTKVTDAKLHDTNYEYNEIDKVKKSTDPLNHITLFDYDLNGNVTKETKPDSHTIGYSYNAVDRQSAIQYDGTDRYTFQYDPNGNTTQEVDKSNNQTTNFTYDADNKLKTKDEGNNNNVTYTYDKDGNVTQRKYVSGSTTLTHDNTFNTLDQLTKIQENTTTRATFTYDEADRVASRKNADGTVSLYKYDGAGNLIQQVNYNTNGTILDTFSYVYDTKGRITSVTSSAGTTTYDYDELDQLKKETRPNGTVYDYTYDEVGNRLSLTVTLSGGSATTTTYTYDNANQISDVNGTNYTYDANGNLTSDGNKTYVYDNGDRLTTVKDSSGSVIASFTYDSEGLRKTMTTSSGTTTFHYDESNNVAYETDSSNAVVASYTWNGNQPVSMTRGGQTYYYQLNGHGDVVALTDSTGAVINTYDYDAFGNVVKQTGTVVNPYLYAGYRYDKETGLYYLYARYYQPNTGRFLSLDPELGEDQIPLTQNGYTYVYNSPVMNIDPDGHSYRRILYSLKYAIRYWLSRYIGWKSAGNVGASVFLAIGGYNKARSAYRATYKNMARLAWKIPRRVFTYSTLKLARRVALRAALRAGIKFVLPATYLADFYDLAYGFYSGYRYKYRWY